MFVWWEQECFFVYEETPPAPKAYHTRHTQFPQEDVQDWLSGLSLSENIHDESSQNQVRNRDQEPGIVGVYLSWNIAEDSIVDIMESKLALFYQNELIMKKIFFSIVYIALVIFSMTYYLPALWVWEFEGKMNLVLFLTWLPWITRFVYDAIGYSILLSIITNLTFLLPIFLIIAGVYFSIGWWILKFLKKWKYAYIIVSVFFIIFEYSLYTIYTHRYETNKPTDCNSYNSTVEKNECLVKLALKLEKVDICSEIVDDYEKNECLEKFVWKLRDSNICGRNSGIYKNFCYENFANETKDGNICEKINDDREAKNRCYDSIARQTKGYNLCDKIDDKSSKYACIYNIANPLNDCERLVIPGYNDASDKCYEQVASWIDSLTWENKCDNLIKFTYSEENMKICRDIQSGIWTVSNICNKIINPEVKKECCNKISGGSANEHACLNEIAEPRFDCKQLAQSGRTDLSDKCYEQVKSWILSLAGWGPYKCEYLITLTGSVENVKMCKDYNSGLTTIEDICNKIIDPEIKNECIATQ